MSLELPRPGPHYDYVNEVETRRLIQAALSDVIDRRADITLQPGQRLILTDEATGALYRIKLASGVLSVEAL